MEQENSCIHIGTRHTKVEGTDKKTFHYGLDQNGYASAIQAASLPEVMQMKDEDEFHGLLQNCVLIRGTNRR
ncbi:MAG: hypothetical protein ACPGSK_05430 [Alphaproteobacteria bacterium]